MCENVARRGPLTLQQIIRNTELTPQQVKNSLLILIQHNCVQAFSFESEGHIPLLFLFYFNFHIFMSLKLLLYAEISVWQ